METVTVGHWRKHFRIPDRRGSAERIATAESRPSPRQQKNEAAAKKGETAVTLDALVIASRRPRLRQEGTGRKAQVLLL